jgi:hypothetical protein
MALSRRMQTLKPMPAAAGHFGVRAWSLAIATSNDQPRGL